MEAVTHPPVPNREAEFSQVLPEPPEGVFEPWRSPTANGLSLQLAQVEEVLVI
jgi:hypothetical protein